MALIEKLNNIGDAIRSKTGKTDLLTLDEMVTEIGNIETGGGSGSSFEISNAGYLFYGNRRLDTLNELCFIISPSCTNFSYMFYTCSSLISVPNLNLNKANYTSYMFYGCAMIENVPVLDLSSCINSSYMYSSCSNLTSVPYMNMPKLEDCQQMFANCKKLNSVAGFSLGNNTYATSMFLNCTSLTEIPEMNTAGVYQFATVFSGCTNLQTLPLLEAGKFEWVGSTFKNCSSLTTMGGLKDLGKAFTSKSSNNKNYTLDLSTSPNLTHDSLMNIINNLYDLNLSYKVADGGTLYTQSLTLGSTNTAKLTADEIAIATSKGWTVS